MNLSDKRFGCGDPLYVPRLVVILSSLTSLRDPIFGGIFSASVLGFLFRISVSGVEARGREGRKEGKFPN